MRASDAFIDAHDEVILSDFLDSYTSDPQVHRFINTFCYMMFAMSCRGASAGEFVHCFREMFKAADTSYPRGGSGAIADAYLRGLERHGGQLHLGRGVVRVLSDGGKVTGVLTDDGKIAADVVVSNVGIDLTLQLAGEESMGLDYARYVAGLDYSGSGVVAKYLLDKQVLDMPAIIYMSDACARGIGTWQAAASAEAVAGLVKERHPL